MRSLVSGVFVAGAVLAQPDPAAPVGRLSDALTPVAFRLDLTILPDQSRFSSHVEIDAALKLGASRVCMHGKALHMTRVVALTGEGPVAAIWTEVDRTVLGPKVRAAGGVSFERTVEGIRHRGDFKNAREAELAAALKADKD